MGSSHQLYQKVWETLRAYHPDLHVKRLSTWVWLVVGLIQSRQVHLSAVALMIPSTAQAAGRIMQLRRWLANPRVEPRTLYRPLIQPTLQQWRGRSLFLIIDGSYLAGERLQVIRIAWSHAYRTIPLAWQVLTQRGNVKVSTCRALLDEAASLIGRRTRVTLLADRGFRGIAWARACRQRDWNYIIRLTANTSVTLDGGRVRRARDLAPKRGERCYYTNVRVTWAKWPCHLALTWSAEGELVIVMTNLPPSKWILNHYLRRMHLEESWRDEKSGSFRLEATRLRDPKRVEALLLAVAVATLWLLQLGATVLAQGRRRLLDPAHKRTLSLFQLGWRYLQRCLACGVPPPCELIVLPIQLPPLPQPQKKC